MERNEMETMQEIQNIYTDVSEWLKFAEAKHAGLFAVWTAVLIAVMSIDGFFDKMTIVRSIVLLLISIGALIDLISFVPFLNRLAFIKKLCFHKYHTYVGNSVFYQSIFIATYSEINLDESVKKYKAILAGKGLTFCNSELEKDYLKQIIEVSTVGTIKVYLFGIATTYAFIVLAVFMVTVIIA